MKRSHSEKTEPAPVPEVKIYDLPNKCYYCDKFVDRSGLLLYYRNGTPIRYCNDCIKIPLFKSVCPMCHGYLEQKRDYHGMMKICLGCVNKYEICVLCTKNKECYCHDMCYNCLKNWE
jgi:hypothetical protein